MTTTTIPPQPWVASPIVGTLSGAGARSAMARVLSIDRPAAFIEDVAAIAGAFLIVAQA
ncbi:hypothetical protein [Rhizorhabdus argentea]|uniref:hypothetical protein n=1 Tax=Rhizorhabdus argentea TaxID=1387174 RepID=UPI0030ECE06E